MNKRPYGKTGKMVSEIAFGAWQLGNKNDWSGMTDSEAIQLVHEALDQGINFFDTAPNYAFGQSEQLLGKAFQGKRDQVVINTKIGHRSDGIQDFSIENIRNSLEGSLKRLQTDYVDSLILHNPPIEILQNKDKHFEILEEIKKEGKILAYGASVDYSDDMIELMKNTDAEIIETMFNIFHQETRLAFDMAKQRNIGLIVKVPLDSGWLSGKYTSDSKFHDIRSRWSREKIERRFELLKKIRDIVNKPEGLLVDEALQFILSYKEVSTVIPGTKTIKQLHQNVQSANNKMPYEIVRKLENLYDDELKNNLLHW